MKNQNNLLVGITGGMGCGQTSLAKFLEEQGAKIIYADFIAHKVVDENTEVKKRLKKAFGRNIYARNGKLKRKLLAKIVFDDENRTKLLNKIVHPPMVERIIEEIEQARQVGNYPFIGIDAALIYEANLEKIFDVVVAVTSKMSNRVERIKSRDKISQKEITNRIRKQLPIEEKAKWADLVIKNDDSLSSLKNKSNSLFKKLTGMSSASKTGASPRYIKN